VVTRRRAIVAAIAIGLLIWGAWSYSSGGLLWVLMRGAAGDSATPITFRQRVESWGALAPAVYVVAVVIEVIVAPIPGTLLYAPAGVLFGGFLGGALSLVGNVTGAAICCAIGAAIGERRLAARLESEKLRPYVEMLRSRAIVVVMLLRLNPLTSSDFVSYAAGAAGVRPWRVAAGTALGMAPLCFAQAYLAEQLFERLPPWLAVAVGVALVLIIVLVLRYGRSRSTR
jgi:uncharacterized membrane protein YdjX (TVP38/TMEM64 family)